MSAGELKFALSIDRTAMCPVLRDFLTYHETILGHSRRTADEYYLDLRRFFRYLKQSRGLVDSKTPFDEIPIEDVDLDLLGSVTITDVYEFVNFLSRECSVGAAGRSRKIATLRSFYKYLTVKAHLLEENPIQNLDSPRLKKALPRYLNLDESIRLLNSVDGANKERDYCILTIFLNCGLRISELAGLNVADVREDQLRVLGKGNKERQVYLNGACISAIQDYLAVRPKTSGNDSNALFISRNHHRLTTSAIHYMVKQRFKQAGLDSSLYSSHKLRHTAATLMLDNGVDVRTLQEVLGHEHLNTTQIYTHVSNENLRSAALANPLAKVKKNKKEN